MEKQILEQVAEIMPEVPAEAIIVPQIVEEDGKRYEVYQESGCISRICIDEPEPETPIDPVPTLEEKIEALQAEVAQIKEIITPEASAEGAS